MTVRAGREFLAIPGPTTMPDEVLRAMHRPALDIYSAEMIGLTDSLLRDLSKLFATEGRSYIYIANGHGAWEATLSNVLSRGDKILVLESGRFAIGWGQAAAGMGVEVEVLKGDWRRAIRPAEVEARLRRDKAGAIKAVLVTQIDTASGVVNDIQAIGKAIRAAGHPALFMVDAVASLGCMPFEMDAWGVDVAMSGSQKGLMAPPGLGFVAANDRAREVHRTAGLRTPYWDWTAREGSRALSEIRRHRARAPVVRAAPGDRHAVRGAASDNVFQRHRLLAEAVRRAVAVWAEGQVLGFNVAEPCRTVQYRHDRGDVERPQSGGAAALLQGKMRRGDRHRHRRPRRTGVPHRPYGPRQRADDSGHARGDRSRVEGARYPPWQWRHRSRDRVARRERGGVTRRSRTAGFRVPGVTSPHGGRVGSHLKADLMGRRRQPPGERGTE